MLSMRIAIVDDIASEREHLKAGLDAQTLPKPQGWHSAIFSLEGGTEDGWIPTPAGLRTAPERRSTKVQAHLHSGHMVLLSVENTYDGKIREEDGVFLSAKRPGEGVGLQAVRHTAEKNGGYSRFHYGDGVFTANVILRGGKSA